MGLTKRWLDETQELTPAERAIANEIEEQAQGNYEDAIRYAAKALRMARAEDDRLTEIIKRKRLEIQRLSFPGLYPPDSPHGQEAVAERIYFAAGQMVEMMEREGMQSDYDVTYHSLIEIAGFGEKQTD
jgi:hypothetical protein